MDMKTTKFRQLFKQQSFLQVFNTRSEINSLFKLLTEEEIDRLNEKNVVFIRSVAPSSKIELSGLQGVQNLTLINVDNNYYSRLMPEEFIGVLLHEIGHALNAELQGMEGEYAADGFASSKGYSQWVINGLRKGLQNNWMGFEKQSCELRIQRLQTNDNNIEEEDNDDDVQ